MIGHFEDVYSFMIYHVLIAKFIPISLHYFPGLNMNLLIIVIYGLLTLLNSLIKNYSWRAS